MGNEETGNRRQVMISLLDPDTNKTSEESRKQSESNVTINDPLNSQLVPSRPINSLTDMSLSNSDSMEMDSSLPLPQVQPKPPEDSDPMEKSSAELTIVKGLSPDGRI